MSDIKSPTILWIKGILFLLLGLLASALLIVRTPNLTVAVLLCLAVWAFCRFYYFTFYVIHHYVDPNYHFSGLISFLRYALWKNRRDHQHPT